MRSFWLVAGTAFAVVHVVVGALSGDRPVALAWFGNLALLAAPVVPIVAITRRRREWRGCQQVFWSTIALGALSWGVGHAWFAFKELGGAGEIPWLGWHTSLSLAGGIAPLVALRALPHRGPQSGIVAAVALEIAALALVAAYLHAYFVVAPSFAAVGDTTVLQAVSQLQRVTMLIAMALAAYEARRAVWGATYTRLAAALAVGAVGRLLLNAVMTRDAYYTGSPVDLNWIVPFFMFAWAADNAPASPTEEAAEPRGAVSSNPWFLFALVGLMPLTDFLVRRVAPMGPLVDPWRDMLTSVAMTLVFCLLTVRIAVEQRARRRADARRRLLAAAIGQTADLTLIVRADRTYEYANEAFCRAVGYTLDEIRALPPGALIAEESQEALLDLRATVQRGGVVRSTLVRRRKDGSTLTVSTTVVPLMNEAGELTHTVSVERDVTDELKLRDQMIHSERLSAVGQLVSGVAHEINNPLQTIVGFTELMLAIEERPEARRDLERIHAEANRAGRIVRNLLAFVRRSPTGRSLESLNDVVQATLALRAYELNVSGIELVEQYDANLPPVLINRDEIQQIVLNLVLNAEQAMLAARGRGRLVVKTHGGPSAAVVEIQDDGPGVPAGLAGRIFEPFFTTKEVGKGTGLGLSVALGIAASHGGRLELVPAREGAHFRLTLPAAAPPAAADAAPPLVDARARPRALVVDDEPAVCDLLTRLLTRRGFDVDVALGGENALARIGSTAYDIVLCDARMPRMSGSEFYARLGELNRGLQRGFVMISGDFSGEITDFARAHGLPLLAKPFTSRELDRVLAQLSRNDSADHLVKKVRSQN